MGAVGIAVCTVGESPLPVAMAALTVGAPHVVLVHSTTTRPVAKRIGALLEARDGARQVHYFELSSDDVEAFVKLHDRLGTSHVEEPQAAPGDTLAEVLWRIGGESRCDFHLDYTGGTAAMVSCLVEFHRRWHGISDGTWARSSYVALANDVLRRDDGTAVALDRSLTVAERASLEGFDIEGARFNGDGGALDVLTDDVLRMIMADGASARLVTKTATSLAAAFEWSGGEGYAPDNPLLAKDRMRRGEEAGIVNRKKSRGVASEITAACIVLAALRMRDRAPADVPSLLGPDEELWFGLTAYDVTASDAREGDVPLAEFDLVFRSGNVVVSAEVKSSDGEGTAGAVLRRQLVSRLVLGDAVRVVWWPLRVATGPRSEALERLLAFMGSPFEVAEHRWPQWTSLDKGAREVWRCLSPWILTHSSEPPPPLPEIKMTPLAREEGTRNVDGVPFNTLVTGLGANPMAIAVAQGLALVTSLVTTVVVTSREPGATVAEPREVVDADPLSARATREAITERVTALRAPVALYITPGTKAVTAALTDVHVEREHATELVHVAIGRDQAAVRGGQKATWRRGVPVNWEHHLALRLADVAPCLRYEPLDPDSLDDSMVGWLHAAMAEAVVKEGEAVAPWWAITGSCACANRMCVEELRPWLPSIIIAGRRRALAVLTLPPHVADAAHHLTARVGVARALLGPAGRPVLVVPDSTDREKANGYERSVERAAGGTEGWWLWPGRASANVTVPQLRRDRRDATIAELVKWVRFDATKREDDEEAA